MEIDWDMVERDPELKLMGQAMKKAFLDMVAKKVAESKKDN